MLRRAADAHNLKLISEVMDISQIELIGRYSNLELTTAAPGIRKLNNYIHTFAAACSLSEHSLTT